MTSVKVKKQKPITDTDNVELFSKEELISKIKALEAHNKQLKNIISKSNQSIESHERKNQKPFDFSKCRFRHIMLKLFYLGWDYHGYATQENSLKTIEYHLFEALKRTCLISDRSSSNYHRCGRTDKGVSSFGQVISLNIRSKLSKENENELDQEIDYCSLLNKILPDDIQCIAWSPVEDNYSARFDCQSRIYKYFFPLGTLDIEKMKTASNFLIGSHDFRNFCKMDVGNGVVEFIRNIKSIQIDPVNCNDVQNEYQMYVITIKGKAFLWHQIRCIMCILILIGQKKEEPEIIKELLDVEKNPRKPEYGMASEIPLNLYHCEYDDSIKWIYNQESLNMVLKKLKNIWIFCSVKQNMVKCMISDLEQCYDENEKDKNITCITQSLVQDSKSKIYVPLMKRPKCESLENKIKHFVKRSRLEIETDS